MDDDLLDGFPPDLLTVHSSQWRSIQVDLGSLGFSARRLSLDIHLTY